MTNQKTHDIPLVRSDLKLLYQNIGGEAQLRSILELFYQKMSQDILVGFFFDGKDIRHIAHQQAAFLLRAMGATPSYSGKSPAQAHDAIAPILEGHFDRRLRILEETLREKGLSEKDIQTWVSFESAFREAVISKT